MSWQFDVSGGSWSLLIWGSFVASIVAILVAAVRASIRAMRGPSGGASVPTPASVWFRLAVFALLLLPCIYLTWSPMLRMVAKDMVRSGYDLDTAGVTPSDALKWLTTAKEHRKHSLFFVAYKQGQRDGDRTQSRGTQPSTIHWVNSYGCLLAVSPLSASSVRLSSLVEPLLPVARVRSHVQCMVVAGMCSSGSASSECVGITVDRLRWRDLRQLRFVRHHSDVGWSPVAAAASDFEQEVEGPGPCPSPKRFPLVAVGCVRVPGDPVSAILAVHGLVARPP